MIGYALSFSKADNQEKQLNANAQEVQIPDQYFIYRGGLYSLKTTDAKLTLVTNLTPEELELTKRVIDETYYQNFFEIKNKKLYIYMLFQE